MNDRLRFAVWPESRAEWARVGVNVILVAVVVMSVFGFALVKAAPTGALLLGLFLWLAARIARTVRQGRAPQLNESLGAMIGTRTARHLHPTEVAGAHPPRSVNRWLREGFLLAGAVGATVLFVIVVKSVPGAPAGGPDGAEWVGLSAFAYGAATSSRVLWWMVRGSGRRHAPSALLVSGVCLLAFGGLGVIDGDRDEMADRYVATLGAGLAAAGSLLRRRMHDPPEP